MASGLQKRFDCYCKVVIRNAIMDRVRWFTKNRNIIMADPINDNDSVCMDVACEDIYLYKGWGDFSQQIENELLLCALKTLSKKIREVVVLSVVYGNNSDYIAAKLNISKNSVFKYKNVGLCEMRKYIVSHKDE